MKRSDDIRDPEATIFLLIPRESQNWDPYPVKRCRMAELHRIQKVSIGFSPVVGFDGNPKKIQLGQNSIGFR